MVYSDYRWTEYSKEDPKISGRLDNNLFDPQEGNELLYFINKMAQLHSLIDKSDGRKMEKMLHDNLPQSIKKQENVKNWVVKNWRHF